ncbi:PREDICTED: CRAL-TRIO domain-containing protein YKL091C-like isoform X2 [Lupinus angustifolius]|uniref:CRAL-TRIO domain-containing protein YKL091C-like isoform X2 n=1 Tax=Lupinus angustifolius TaxID=3871 RepID=UPI00092F1B50|nr:PREDICTED: CRAL-TRIO domain-containing protein YKL091C-like isoform X2 [Lupinus angustifolius]
MYYICWHVVLLPKLECLKGKCRTQRQVGWSVMANHGVIEQVVVDDEGVEKDSSESEITKIQLMRDFVETRDPSSKEDDLMLRRFLRARGLDIEKASTMFLKYLKWRHSFVPNGSISTQEIPNELADDKVFAQGHDKSGRPIGIICGAKHFQNKNGLEEFKRFVVYAFDKLCASMPPGQEKFFGIADLKGWKYSNCDVRGYISGLNILQDYYPERFGKFLIVHAPYIFMKVWKMIYPVLDDKTKKKIILVEKNKLKSTLMEDIDESQLPEIYGGPLPLVPIQHI